MKGKLLFITCICIAPILAVGQKLRVAVAANTQFVSEELAEAFKKETGIEVETIVSSSGKLTAQIEQGAPFDMFLSADMKYPQALYSKQLTTAKPQIYAYGVLVLWTNKDSKATIATLSRSSIKKIAIADPRLAPYGEATIQALTKLKLLDQLRPKIVYGESIAQVNQYLLTGATEAAFTAKSVVLDPAQQGKGQWAEVDAKLYQPIAQGVVILKSASNLAKAQKFYKFLLGSKAQQIFKKYGYK